RVSEAQVSRAEHFSAPARGPLRPEPDLLLPGRQQEQGKPAPVGAPPGGPASRSDLRRAVDRGRAPDGGRPAGIYWPPAGAAVERAGTGSGEGLGLSGGRVAARHEAREVVGD